MTDPHSPPDDSDTIPRFTTINEIQHVLPERVGPDIVPEIYCHQRGDDLTNLLEPDPDNNGTLWPVVVVVGIDMPKPHVAQTRPHVPPWHARMNADGVTETIVYASSRYTEADSGSLILEYTDVDDTRERIYIGADEIEASYLVDVQAISEVEYLRSS